jgi:nitroreductase
MPEIRVGLLRFVGSLARILAGRPRVPSELAQNALLRTILSRRSVRSFADRDISEAAFSAILEAGRLAPSTVNLQTWAFATFTQQSWSETFGRPIPFGAKRAVIVMGDVHRVRSVMEAFPRSPLIEYTTAVMNASLAAMNMNIAAEALGVSSVMLSETGRSGLLDMAYLGEKLALPEGVFPLMTIVFGFRRGLLPPMPPKLPSAAVCFGGTYREVGPRIMDDWMAQMVSGYKASHPRSSFGAQLELYQSKIGRAEADLQARVFRGWERPPGVP